VRIKVEADLPRTVVGLLRSAGFEDTLSFVEQEMGGWKDDELWPIIQDEHRFLITADKGFADIRKLPPGSHAGVLLLRPHSDGIWPCVQLLNQVLAQVDLTTLEVGTTVATPQGVRTRFQQHRTNLRARFDAGS